MKPLNKPKGLKRQGERLRTVLWLARLTQTDVARFCGRGQAAVSKWVSGKRSIPRPFLRELGRLGLNEKFILDGTEPVFTDPAMLAPRFGLKVLMDTEKRAEAQKAATKEAK